MLPEPAPPCGCQTSEDRAPEAPGVLRLPEGAPARPCGPDGSMGAGQETASGAWPPARHTARAAGASAAPDCGPPRRSWGRRGDGVRHDTRCITPGALDARAASRSSAGPAWEPRAPQRAPGGGAWGPACAPGHRSRRLPGACWTCKPRHRPPAARGLTPRLAGGIGPGSPVYGWGRRAPPCCASEAVWVRSPLAST